MQALECGVPRTLASAPLDAGGIGEVYKARDTRLDRFVAIKVLPENIASRQDLRQRILISASMRRILALCGDSGL